MRYFVLVLVLAFAAVALGACAEEESQVKQAAGVEEVTSDSSSFCNPETDVSDNPDDPNYCDGPWEGTPIQPPDIQLPAGARWVCTRNVPSECYIVFS